MTPRHTWARAIHPGPARDAQKSACNATRSWKRLFLALRETPDLGFFQVPYVVSKLGRSSVMVLGSQKMRPVRDAVAAWLPQGHGWLELLGGGAILLALYILGQNNYLFFHGLTETFTIVISCALFVVFWNTRGLVDHGFFLVIGIACFFAAMLNLLHMLAHPRMALLSPGDGNISMQAKIACQWMASLSGCAAFLFVRRRVNQNRAMVFYSLLLAAILASIFVWHVFPDCVVAGRPTPFARLARLASCGAFLAMAMLLVVRRGMFEPKIFRLMLVAILAMAADELASVLSSNPEGFFKVAGHLIQVVALYLIYKAFIQVGLTQPLSLLFRGLKQGEEANRRLASIVQCTQDAIISEDLHGTILSWNPAAERIYGYRAEEIIGRSLDLLMRPVHQTSGGKISRSCREVKSRNLKRPAGTRTAPRSMSR